MAQDLKERNVNNENIVFKGENTLEDPLAFCYRQSAHLPNVDNQQRWKAKLEKETR